MNKFISILAGLILLLAPLVAWITNWVGFGTAATEFLKGGLVWLFLLIGALLLLTGLISLRD
ncbi:MAG: hypothetical protein ABIF88_02025 [archaeon]